MKVAGLNNQGFQSTAKAPAGKFHGKEKSSFESILGEAHAQDQDSNPTARESDSQTREHNESTQYPKSAAPQNQAGKDVQPDAEPQESAESLPSGQGLPEMGAPGLTGHAISAPVNPAYLNPMSRPAQPLKADQAANTLTRRVVWNDFLRKMNDLGVSAEDVLRAFGSLSEKDLAQPPELSLDKIVAALGLNGQPAVQAKQYFSELIAKTKSKNFGEELSASSKQLSLSLMSQRDLQRKTLLKSIDKLGDNFFMNGPAHNAAALKGEQKPMIGADGKPMAPPVLPENPQENFSQMNAANMLTGNRLPMPEIPSALPSSAGASASEGPVAAATATSVSPPRSKKPRLTTS